ncbi:MAG: hypothetical protein PHX61_11660 [Alphaproteobacteria bacterium]|nr:hypothetical protein [Alphaproteobacteria bacterium]
MKKILILLLGFSAVLILAAEHEKLILEWDFNKGVNPIGSNIKFTVRGGTKIINGALETNQEATPSCPEGIEAESNDPNFTPREAFRFVVELELKEPTSQKSLLLLWDNKGDYYSNNDKVNQNSGFTIGFQRASNGYIRPQAWLGFGKSSAALSGKFVKLEIGKKYQLVFDYDGTANAAFTIDGKLNAKMQVVPGGPLAPAVYKTTIGDRSPGNFLRFDGRIHNIKIFTRQAAVLQAKTVGRAAFIRNEKDAFLSVSVRNNTNSVIENFAIANAKKKVLMPNETFVFTIPINTKLKTGSYPVTLSYSGGKNNLSITGDISLPYRVAPLPADSMPIIMWGYEDSFKILKKSGFTLGVTSLVEHNYRNPNNFNKFADFLREFDDMLCEDFRQAEYFCISHYSNIAKKFPRVDRNGNPLSRLGLDANNPDAIKYLSNYADTAAKLYAPHPALAMIDINSEIRDKSNPSFSMHEVDKFKKFSGQDIPQQINSRSSSVSAFNDFPPFGVVPDNYLPLVYYKWFWKDGDGWLPMHKTIGDLYKKQSKCNINTYFAPAVRQPPIWGYAGRVDIISQWTYSYPDPICLAAAVDETLAMAAESPSLKVMHGIQLICYRSQTAPVNIQVENPPEWSKKYADAKYITIPPDHCRATLWCLLSRGINGLVYHGDGSLYSNPKIKKTASYICTNNETEKVFEHDIMTIVKPLGPTLKRIPESSRDVAILHSFASAMFAGRGSYGWSGWLMDCHMALQWGGLDPRVIYEEEIVRDNLAGIKVLVLTNCDILPESVYNRIIKFQQSGGIIIADKAIPAGILPDIQINQFNRNYGDAESSKTNLQKLGMEIRTKLGNYYKPFAYSDNADIVVHSRRNRDADYIFAINDKRAYGNYLGAWKRVMEKGLPNKGTVTVNRIAGAVYNAVEHTMAKFIVKDGKTEIFTEFKTTDGRLFVIMPEKIEKVTLSGSEILNKGVDNIFMITVNGASGKLLNAEIPLEITVKNADGDIVDGAGFVCAEKGSYKLNVIPGGNEKSGKWRIHVRDLLSNTKAEKEIFLK